MHMQAIEYRKKYIAQYVKCLQEGSMGGDEAIAEMDAQLNEHTILTFRKLAHAKARDASSCCVTAPSGQVVDSKGSPYVAGISQVQLQCSAKPRTGKCTATYS